ncbi:MAG: alpha/beta fold hydrolase [Planctomycetota bacterium]
MNPKTSVQSRRLLILLVGGSVLAFSVAALVVGYLAYLLTRPSFTLPEESLAEYRAAHPTELTRSGPAPQRYKLLKGKNGQWLEFPSDGRLLFGYFRAPPNRGSERSPVVVVCHGGFALGEEDIAIADRFVSAGFAVFVPTFRGENGNAGEFEMAYGEVDDVIAALEFAAGLPQTIPDQVFLAGHSIGAVSALLAAEMSSTPRAVFCCGAATSWEEIAKEVPTDEDAPYAWGNMKEQIARSPASFTKDLRCPAMLAYGSEEPLLLRMGRETVSLATAAGKQMELVEVANSDHFSAWSKSIATAIKFFREQQSTSRAPVASKGFLSEKNATRKLILEALGDAELPEKATSRGTLDLSPWQPRVDPGPAIPDWQGFVDHYNVGTSPEPTRVFRGNPHWVCSRSLTHDFHISSANGEVRHRFLNPMAVMFSGVSKIDVEPAGISLDGEYFAIRTTTDPEMQLLTMHRTSDGKLVQAVGGYEGCQFLSNDTGIAWLYPTDEARELERQRRYTPPVTGKDKPGIGPPERQFVLFNLTTNELSAPFNGQAGTTFVASPGGNFLYMMSPGENETTLDVWSCDTLQKVFTSQVAAVPNATDLAVSQDGKRLGMIGNGRVAVFEMESGRCLWDFDCEPKWSTVHWLAGGRFLVLGAELVVEPGNKRILGELLLTQTDRGKLAYPESSNGQLFGDYLCFTRDPLGRTDVAKVDRVSFEMMARSQRPTKAMVTSSIQINRSANLERGFAFEELAHQWFIENSWLPNEPNGKDCELRYTTRMSAVKRDNTMRPSLTLFGTELPDGLEASGLPTGILSDGTYVAEVETDFSLLATKGILREDRDTRQVKLDQTVLSQGSHKGTMRLDTVELSLPAESQLIAATLGEAAQSISFPTDEIRLLGRAKLFPNVVINPTSVGFDGFGAKKLSAREWRAPPPAEYERRFPNYWPRFAVEWPTAVKTFKVDFVDSVVRGKTHAARPLNAISWKVKAVARNRESVGEVVGATLLETGGKPELLLVLTAGSGGTEPTSAYMRSVQLEFLRIDANGNQRTIKTPVVSIVPNARLEISHLDSNGWFAYTPGLTLTGNANSDEIRILQEEKPSIRKVLGMSGDGNTLLVKDRKGVLYAADSSSLWDNSNPRFRIDDLPVRVVAEKTLGPLCVVPKTSILVAIISDPSDRKRVVAAIDLETNEQLWRVPMEEYCKYLSPTSDGKFVQIGDFQSYRLVDLKTGAVKEERNGQAVIAASDTWLLSQAGRLNQLLEPSNFEPQFSFGAAPSIPVTPKVLVSRDGSRAAFIHVTKSSERSGRQSSRNEIANLQLWEVVELE